MKKLKGLIQKRYLESGKGWTKVTIPQHPVPKGPTDIRVVCNLTSNGVNHSIYNPSFFLSTDATLYHRIEEKNGTRRF
jgi:hypothetical protein